MSEIDYRHYAERVYEQAVYNPEINHSDLAQIIAYSDEVAELILIDEERLFEEVVDIARMSIMSSF